MTQAIRLLFDST